jgi:hypothetical protein
MKMTREQEIKLIEIGLDKLFNDMISSKHIPWNKGLKTGKKKRTGKTGAHKWSAAQRARFSKTMKAKWAARKNGES